MNFNFNSAFKDMFTFNYEMYHFDWVFMPCCFIRLRTGAP